MNLMMDFDMEYINSPSDEELLNYSYSDSPPVVLSQPSATNIPSSSELFYEKELARMVTEDAITKRLKSMDASQESVETLSLWCLHHRDHHHLIASTWMSVFRTGSEAQRLALLFLANDICQKAKRKRGMEVVRDAFVPKLLEAITLIRLDETLKDRMERMFKIWDERVIFDSKTIGYFRNALSMTFDDAPDVEERFILDFDAEKLITDLEKHEKCEESIEKARLLLMSFKFDFESRLKECVKDRKDGMKIVNEVQTANDKMGQFVVALEQQLRSHHELISLLEQGRSFFEQQLKDATIVADAYQKFGNGIQDVKDQLEEMLRIGVFLGASPPRDAPSPSACDDPFAEGVEQAIVEFKKPGARDIFEASDMDLEEEIANPPNGQLVPQQQQSLPGANYNIQPNQSFLPPVRIADPRIAQRYQKQLEQQNVVQTAEGGGTTPTTPAPMFLPAAPTAPPGNWSNPPPAPHSFTNRPPPPFTNQPPAGPPPSFQNFSVPPPAFSPPVPMYPNTLPTTTPASGPIISGDSPPPPTNIGGSEFMDNQNMKGLGCNRSNLTMLGGPPTHAKPPPIHGRRDSQPIPSHLYQPHPRY